MSNDKFELRVGNVGETGWHFIGVSKYASEVVKNVGTGKSLRVIKFERSDIPWLIAALQRELELRPLEDEATV